MKTERIDGVLCFDIGRIRSTIEVAHGRASIYVCEYVGYEHVPACMPVDDAVAMLRAMLRELAGPSIDDVREAWGDQALHVHRYDMLGIPSLAHIGHTYEVEDGDGQDVAPRDPWHHSEADALRAAYDAAPKREDA